MFAVKNSKILIPSLCLGLLMLIVTACAGPSFKINGTIEGADKASLALEKADFTGNWIVIDSIHTSADGKFSVKADAPKYPELYRVSFNDRYIYIPIDSVETITLTADAQDFGTRFSMVGSDQAELMSQFQNKLAGLPLDNPDSVKVFKRWVLSNVVLASQGNPTVMGYYALTCRTDRGQLFNVNNPEDAQVFAAVATAYQQYRPDDPRAKSLETLAIQAMRNANTSKGRQRVVEAPHSSIIDFELNDQTGNPTKLSSFTTNGHPTLLIFSLMGQDNSPEVNRGVATLYETYGREMNFVMVCLDTDIAVWRERVRAIPWVTLIDPTSTRSPIARDYNLKGLPTFFLFNSKGELVDRAESFADLTKKLKNLQ